MFWPLDVVDTPARHTLSGISNVPVKIPEPAAVSTSENPEAERPDANAAGVAVLLSVAKQAAVFALIPAMFASVHLRSF